jgi:hypothetical protein
VGNAMSMTNAMKEKNKKDRFKHGVNQDNNMIYNWEKYYNTLHPCSIQGIKLTKVSIIIDGKVVKESTDIREISHA